MGKRGWQFDICITLAQHYFLSNGFLMFVSRRTRLPKGVVSPAAWLTTSNPSWGAGTSSIVRSWNPARLSVCESLRRWGHESHNADVCGMYLCDKPANVSTTVSIWRCTRQITR